MLGKCQLVMATGGTIVQDLTMQWSTLGGFMQDLSFLVIDEGQQCGTDREIVVISLLKQQPSPVTGDSANTRGNRPGSSQCQKVPPAPAGQETRIAQQQELLRRPCCNGADFAPISRAGFLDRKMWRINAQVQPAGRANRLKLGCCDPQVGLYAKVGCPLKSIACLVP